MIGPDIQEMRRVASVIISTAKILEEHSLPTPQIQTINVHAWRVNIICYLEMLQKHLQRIDDVDAELLEPLAFIAEQIRDLEWRGLDPILFTAAKNPWGTPKPVVRLMAEGHAVGCVCYLNETVGDGLVFACKVVASMFSWLGHRGRIAQNLHNPQDDVRLSWKTLYQWHGELAMGDELSGADSMRRVGKIAAIQSLEDAERRNPILVLPTEEFRMSLAERIFKVAAKTRIGMPGEPEITLVENSEST